MATSDHAHCRLLLPLLVAGAMLAACDSPATPDSNSRQTAPAPSQTASFNTTSVTEPETGPFARIVEGQIGPGALYALYIPRSWNGDAIYYVHGIRDASAPVDLGNQGNFFAIRDVLGAQGYAIAYSSWSANGLVVKDGAQRVHQMRGILTSELHQPPARSFVLGSSLGGLVALDLLETFPEQYDGALMLCGMLGGLGMEGAYDWNVRVLFDLFYPGVWPGSPMSTPPDAPPVTVPQLTAAVEANPTPLFLIASLAQTPLAFRPLGNPLDTLSAAFDYLVGSLYTALSFSSTASLVFDLTHGHDFFDNTTTTYAPGTNPLLPASVLQPMVDFANAHVARYAADPSAGNFFDHYYTPTGDIHMPVLTYHTNWDPVNPVFHEDAFRAKVIAAGKAGNLLQRLYPAYGHCPIPVAVVTQSFQDMVNWVTTGVRPPS
jgi:pimeloyl-ACP methyl ester carboxylesterase